MFALTGLAVGGLGQLFSAHDSLLTRILGVVTIVLGLLFFGAFDRFMFAGRVFKPSVMPKAGLAGAPLLGVLFGIGWTPCIGPTLTAVLALSASSGTAARGAFLAFIYGLGLGIPFLIVAVAFQRLVGVLNFFKRNARMVTRVGGVLLVAVGLLEATGAWTTAITWLHTHWFNGYQLPLLGARFSAVTDWFRFRTGQGSACPRPIHRAWPALPAGARLRLHRDRLARRLRLGPLRGARLARRLNERGEQAGIVAPPRGASGSRPRSAVPPPQAPPSPRRQATSRSPSAPHPGGRGPGGAAAGTWTRVPRSLPSRLSPPRTTSCGA